MSHKIFDNNLVAIRQSKVVLTLNEPTCMHCNVYFQIKQSIKHEFYQDYIKNKHGNNSFLVSENSRHI